MIANNERTRVRNNEEIYDFPTYASREMWEARAEYLRRRVLVSAGLWPMPEKYPLQPQVTGCIQREDYLIENVYFESIPGFLVTGNLYRPVDRSPPLPAILSPHGHWKHGRLEHSERGSIPARCINFACQGYVAFAYDMIGYNDSGLQVSHGDPDRPEVGFCSRPGPSLWGISLLGMQLWNSIRAVDFLSSLPYVDAQRIGCTGASGGGTQTFLLTAIDRRIKVAAPVNMISAHFQGGCLCENAPNLRLDCSNVELAAAMAPRPLLMVSATGDWTKNTPHVEFPAVQSIYRLYGATDRVATVQVDAGHNYNRESREAVYTWFGRWFQGLEGSEKINEREVEVPSPREMLVFPDGKLPPNTLGEEQVAAHLIQAAQEQIQALRPSDAATLQAYRAIFGTSYRYAINANEPLACDLREETVDVRRELRYQLERVVIGQEKGNARMPGLLWVPENPVGGVLVVHPQGKAALMKGVGPRALIAKLLEHQLMVLGIDVFKTGELASVRREDVAYFHTYNRSDVALQIQDVLNGIAYLKARVHHVHLVGLERAGPLCLLARGLTRDIDRTVVDGDQLNCDDDKTWLEQLFVPQVRRAGDLRTVAALTAPEHLFVHNASKSFPTHWFHQVYQVTGAPAAFQVRAEQVDTETLVDVIVSRDPGGEREG